MNASDARPPDRRRGKLRRIPPEHSRRMIEAYQAGATASEAAAVFGYNRSTCLHALIAAGVQRRRLGDRPEALKEEVVRLYRRGCSVRFISEAVGLKPGAIRYTLGKAGEIPPVYHPHGPAPSQKKFTGKKAAALIAFYNSPESPTMGATARHFNTTTPTVRKTLLADGVVPRVYVAPGPFTSAEVQDAIVESFCRHKRTAPVVAEFNCSVNTVRDVLVAHGVKPPGHSESSRRYHFDEGFFEKIDTEAKAYWLGFLLADGSVSLSATGGSVRVLLAARDDGHLRKLFDAVKHPGRLHYFTQKPHKLNDQLIPELPGVSVALHSRRMALDLCHHGVVPRKSFTAVPWSGSPELMRHYWRGVVDGDGWVCRRETSVVRPYNRFTLGLCGSLPTVEAFASYCHLVHKSLTAKPSLARHGSMWYVAFNGAAAVQEAVRRLYDGASVSLDRKKRKADEVLAVHCALRRWSHLTAEALLALRPRFCNWAEVGRHLGMCPCVINNVRRRLGMT